jgi:hypothetical protein
MEPLKIEELELELALPDPWTSLAYVADYKRRVRNAPARLALNFAGVGLCCIQAPRGQGEPVRNARGQLERPPAWRSLDEHRGDLVAFGREVFDGLRALCPKTDLLALEAHADRVSAQVLSSLLPPSEEEVDREAGNSKTPESSTDSGSPSPTVEATPSPG